MTHHRGAFCPQISNSPAFTFLEELLSAGKLTTAQVQLYRSKYSKLHDVVLKTYENEKNLLKKAKQLNQDLSAERGKLEKAAAAAQEDSDTIASLRAEVGKGESELAMREERELLLQQELHDLQGVRNELQGEVTATKKKQVQGEHRTSRTLARADPCDVEDIDLRASHVSPSADGGAAAADRRGRGLACRGQRRE
mgnify:CR=1 FL=1